VSRHQLPFPVQDHQTKGLEYLQACIREGLRLYQPLFQLRERVVPPGGDYIQGYRVPEGTFVGINASATQLDGIYGDDTEIFRPERWLLEDGPRKRRMLLTLDLVFGGGKTRCLGSQMAYMEMNKIVFEVRLVCVDCS